MYPKRHTNSSASQRGTENSSTVANSRIKPHFSHRADSAGASKSLWSARPYESRRDQTGATNNSSSSSTASALDAGNTSDSSRKSKVVPPFLQSVKEQVNVQNFGNDYSDVYVRHGILPQAWVQNAKDPLKGYPKLQRLHELKHQQFERYATPAIGLRCPENKIVNTIESMISLDMQFDVLMVHGCMEMPLLESLSKLPLENLSARPSLLFLWVPSDKIAQGRQLMDKWGFRRGEDIVYIVDSLTSQHAPAVDSWSNGQLLFRSSTWHCLMGLKGTLRRSTNTELIHCNVDTDVIFETEAEKSNIVPDKIYTIIQNFTSMSRKIHIVPQATPGSLPVRSPPGWVVLSPDCLSVGSLNPAKFRTRSTIPTSREIDLLRPQTPPLGR